MFAISKVDFIMDHVVPLLSNCTFFTKKFADFQDFVLAGSIIYSGKDTTEQGAKFLDFLRKGMNTGRSNSVDTLHKDSLAKEILDMEPIYCQNSDGLRINIETLALIPSQIFYILASSSDGKDLFFIDAE